MTDVYYQGFGEDEIEQFEAMPERIQGNLMEYERSGEEGS